MKTISAGLFASLLSAMLATSALAQQFTIKVSSPTVNDVTQEWMKAFKSGVDARSGGKIKIETYPAGQLGQIPATVEGVAMGTIEIVAPATGFLVGLEPRFIVFDAPGLFDDLAHAQRVLSDPSVKARIATFGASKGVEPLAVFVHGPLMVLSHKAIRSTDDFKGQKLRVPGPTPLHIEPLRKLGASPLSMSLGEVLPAMQNRTVDGLTAGANIFTAFKYYDVAKTLTRLPGAIIAVGALANKDFLKSLGPDLEKVVREEADKAQGVATQVLAADVDRVLQAWKANGGEIIDFSPAETKKYNDLVTSVLPPILAANAKLKEDYAALSEVAKKTRQ